MESRNLEDGWRNTTTICTSTGRLQCCPLQDKLEVTLPDSVRQVSWMMLLLGCMLSISTDGVKEHTAGRRLVLQITPAVLLLAATCPVTSPLLQSSSAQAALIASLVAIFEVACVVELLHVKPFGLAAAVIGATLRLGTALALFLFKPASSEASLWLLPPIGFLAPTIFLIIVVFCFKASLYRNEYRCSRPVFEWSLGLATRTPLPQAPATLAIDQTSNLLRRQQQMNPSSTTKKHFQYELVKLRRSTRVRRPVDRYDPSV